MKSKNISVSAFIALPLALLASSATDRKFEEAAKVSYNYRAVLENNVSAKASDGVKSVKSEIAVIDNSTGSKSAANDMIVRN